MQPSTFSLLLVEPDAAGVAPQVEAAFAGLRVTACGTLLAARAHLAGTAFDAVLTAAELPDGAATELLALGETIGLPPVWVRAETPGAAQAAATAGAAAAFVAPADARSLAAAVAIHGALWPSLGDAEPAAPAEPPPQAESSTESPDAESPDGEIAHALQKLAHDLGNPLSVVVGNAQLLRELLRGSGDETVLSSLDDIEAASGEIRDLIAEVRELRLRVEGRAVAE